MLWIKAQAEHDAHRAADAAYAESYSPSISASVQAARARYLKRQEEIAQQNGGEID